MAIFLVQHGKSLPKEIDPDRGLSEKGIAEVKRICEIAKASGVKISGIHHSGKTRAHQTAEIFTAILDTGGGVQQISGMNPLDDVADFTAILDPFENLMFVGHLPFMERLTSLLITGSIEIPVFKFQNGGILCLDKDSDAKSWVIRWSLVPNI